MTKENTNPDTSLQTRGTVSLQRFTTDVLGHLNDHIERGEWPIEFLSKYWSGLLGELASDAAAFRHLDKRDARLLLGLLAFVASSAERHYQAKGFPKGAGVSALSHMEAMLSDLSGPAQHIPKDSFSTYWLWNRGPGLRARFTGDSQEFIFADAVIATHDIQAAVARDLRPLCQNRISLSAPEAAASLNRAAQATSELCRIYQALRPPRFSPQFFTERMRTYLVSYPVGNVTYEAVNAADLPAQVSVDYLLGFPADDYYMKFVHRRMQQMIPEDQAAVNRDVATPSLLQAVAKGLSLSLSQFCSLDAADVVRLLAYADPEFRQSALAAGQLYREQQRLTGIHFSLIKQFLINYAKQIPSAVKTTLPVAPNAGTGGTGHEATRSIMEMRMKHPAAVRLVQATTVLAKED